MKEEILVPTLGESITEATVSKWLKKIGDSFDVDEPLVHQRGNFRVFKAFVSHYMAPVTGRITNT